MSRRSADAGGVAAPVVWIVWAVMLVVALVFVARFGRDIPLAEDWTMVPALTGREEHLWRWLWSQNNEHRVPLPRLIFLALLRLTGGDFRSGMVFNTLAMGGVAAAMIATARHLRGHVALQDLFFPLALLHLGHWINLAWSWQIQFVSSFVLISLLLLVIVRQVGALSRGEALMAAAAIVLLPFTGAIGLIFDAALAPWVLATAWLHLRAGGAQRGLDGGRATGWLLAGAFGLAAVTGVLYFVGYERPAWNPPSPGHVETLKTAGRFLALGFGPWAAEKWRVSVAAILLFLVPSLLLVCWRLTRDVGAARLRPFGLLSFGGAMVVLALGIGWGRAAQFPAIGLPNRYVLFAVPALCAAFFAWELYASKPVRPVVPMALALTLAVGVPRNTRYGLEVRDWYVAGMTAAEEAIDAALDPEEIAERQGSFLLHWNKAQLAERIRMLRTAGHGPFAR
jgi:hypothetical protein